MKPVLAVDIDDVLVPHEVLLAEQFKRHLRSNYPYSHLVSLDLKSETDEFRRQTIELIEGYIGSEEFFKLNPLENAAAVLVQLQSFYKLVVVSVRPNPIKTKTEVWLKQHFGNIFDEVHFVHLQRWGQGPKSSKLDLLKQLKASVLVDDSLRHVSMATEAGVRGILFGNYDWNQVEELPDGVVRAEDWLAVVRLLIPGGVI